MAPLDTLRSALATALGERIRKETVDRGQLTLEVGEHLFDHVSTDSTALANDFHSLRSRSSSARPRRVSR